MKACVFVFLTIAFLMLPLKAEDSLPVGQTVKHAVEKGSLKETLEYLAEAGIPVCMVGDFDFEKSPNDAKIGIKNGTVFIGDGVDYGLGRAVRFSVKNKSVSAAFEGLSKKTGLIFVQIDKGKHSRGLIVNIAESFTPMSVRDILAAIAGTAGIRISLSPIKGPNVGEILGFSVSLSRVDSIKEDTK